jgi:hypothetical protein
MEITLKHLLPPNQALPPNKTAGKQAVGMSVVHFTLRVVSLRL